MNTGRKLAKKDGRGVENYSSPLYGAMDAETGRDVRRSMYHEEQNRDYTKANVNVTSGNSTKLTKGDSKDISHVTTISGRIP